VSTPLLEVDNLAVTFPTDGGDLYAVRGLSYHIAPGEVVAMVGESGSGKSAAAMAVIGLLPPYAEVSGSVRLGDKELLGSSDADMSTIRGARIGTVFQDPMSALTPVYTVGDQIAEAITVHHAEVGRADARRRAVELLDLVGITAAETRARSFPHELSGGERQRVVIAIAIANDPDLILRWASRLGNKFFLFVGVLRYYKGLHILLEAAGHTQANIVILGEGPEGVRLRLAAQRLGLSNVHFVGALPDADKNALFELCRAVVFPSHLRSEAFGMTLLEGARACKPLICCEIGTGTTAINIHLESGLVVPPDDPLALSAAIDRLAADDDLHLRLGQGARARWQRHFTPRVVGQAYQRLYEELLLAKAEGDGIVAPKVL